jgi:hypothetical protein
MAVIWTVWTFVLAVWLTVLVAVGASSWELAVTMVALVMSGAIAIWAKRMSA